MATVYAVFVSTLLAYAIGNRQAHAGGATVETLAISESIATHADFALKIAPIKTVNLACLAISGTLHA